MPKVAEKKQAAAVPAGRPWMPVLLRDVPPGHKWGWYSREEPRMHLQSVERKYRYKVWLENKGERVIEPVGRIPPKVLQALAEVVSENRLFIEDNWVDFMLDQGWLALHIALPKLTLVAYPNMPTKFTRVINLTTWLNPKALATLTPDVIELNRDLASLRLWTNRPEEQTFDARLSRLLWGNEVL